MKPFRVHLTFRWNGHSCIVAYLNAPHGRRFRMMAQSAKKGHAHAERGH